MYIFFIFYFVYIFYRDDRNSEFFFENIFHICEESCEKENVYDSDEVER